jgi:hypothetical protein
VADLLDPSSWEVVLLPIPKKFSRGKALGFCGSHPVGMIENARAKAAACWWPNGEPELLTYAGAKDVNAGLARDGNAIPGQWLKGSSGATGAVVWRLRDGKLAATELHDQAFEKTWASCAERGLVLGAATHKGKMGARPKDTGLVWREDGTRADVTAAEDVALECTDGVRLGGSIGGRAALWPDAGAAAVDLAPDGYYASEVRAIDGETQAGIAFKGMRARAALWKGTAASFVDLTPDGYEVGRVFHAINGCQAGFVRRADTTRNGSSNCADQAALWAGSSQRWLDLNALLPPQSGLNASVAWTIEQSGDRLQICGEASRYEASDAGTDRESHFVPAAQAVIWRTRS